MKKVIVVGGVLIGFYIVIGVWFGVGVYKAESSAYECEGGNYTVLAGWEEELSIGNCLSRGRDGYALTQGITTGLLWGPLLLGRVILATYASLT